MGEQRRSLEARVASAAEAALADQSYVSPIDVLIGVGWLTPQALDVWRQGRVDDLERLAQANLAKLSAAMVILDRWATDRGLHPSQSAYIAQTRDRRQLRFSRSGDADIEAAYRTHRVSPEASEAERRRIEKKQNAAPDLVVIAALEDWTCTACSGTGELLIMESPGPVCLACADLTSLATAPTPRCAPSAARSTAGAGQEPDRGRRVANVAATRRRIIEAAGTCSARTVSTASAWSRWRRGRG